MHSTSHDADLQLEIVLWEMQIEDMEVYTAAASPNPITHVTFTGFQFTPKRNYYQTFQSGTSAKLAVGFAYIY